MIRTSETIWRKPGQDRVLLLIDCSYQIYRASAAHADLTAVDGTFTGGVYGFLQVFGKMVRETEATDVVLCCDSKPYLRSRDYPEYKQLRKKNADDELLQAYLASEPLVLNLFESCGVPIWSVPGFESDDLVGLAVTRHRSRYKNIFAASNDSDLYQLFGAKNFAVYKDHIRSVVNHSTLAKQHGVTPDEFMLMTALQGTHNDIAGIPKVGPVTALKAIKDPATMRKYRDSHGDIIDRNLKLIKLPHPELPLDTPMPRRISSFDRRPLYRFCAKLDIQCTAAMLEAFEQIS